MGHRSGPRLRDVWARRLQVGRGAIAVKVNNELKEVLVSWPYAVQLRLSIAAAMVLTSRSWDLEEKKMHHAAEMRIHLAVLFAAGFPQLISPRGRQAQLRDHKCSLKNPKSKQLWLYARRQATRLVAYICWDFGVLWYAYSFIYMAGCLAQASCEFSRLGIPTKEGYIRVHSPQKFRAKNQCATYSSSWESHAYRIVYGKSECLPLIRVLDAKKKIIKRALLLGTPQGKAN